MSILIRDYQSGDREQVEACLAALQDVHRVIEPEDHLPGSAVAARYLVHLLESYAKPEGRFVVAEEHGVIVGCMTMSHITKDEKDFLYTHSTYVYVGELYVSDSHRGKGIGKALLQHAEGFARACGERFVMLTVLAKNEAARAVYAKGGFREYNLMLSKEVE